MSQFKTICREVIRHRFRLVTADVKVTRPAEGGSCVAKRIEISMEWQPIETAPRDGTRILLYRPLADRTNDDGFLIGYEPTGRDKIKSPNVEFSGEGKRSLTDSAGTQG